MITKSAKKKICGNSAKITEIADTNFDIFFYIVGWETRFTEIINRLGGSFTSEQNVVCSFKKGGNKGYDEQKKKEFIEKLDAHTNSKADLIEFEYSDFKNFNEQIEQIIYSKLEKKQRPLKIGFDISSCPRYYFLFVLGLCIVKNYTYVLSFFYSEGVYSDIVDDDEFFNSYGEKKEVIPYSGSAKIEGKRIFVFSLGFESSFIIKEIDDGEPYHVIFLCANPGYTPKYEEKVIDEFKRIVNYCKLPDGMYT